MARQGTLIEDRPGLFLVPPGCTLIERLADESRAHVVEIGRPPRIVEVSSAEACTLIEHGQASAVAYALDAKVITLILPEFLLARGE